MSVKNKHKKDDYVRCFEVSDPTLHPKGHTIYKISQKLIPVDVPDQSVEQIIVWRRYNDIKKLYKAMLQLHKALHRKEEFPPFCKATVFGRFEKDVIIERQRCAQDLLNFLGQRHYFVISKAFQQFFQDGEKSVLCDGDLKILQPSRISDLVQEEDELTCNVTQDSDLESLSSDILFITGGIDNTDFGLDADLQGAEMSNEEMLGGVWKYRQVADKISLGGIDDDDDENTDFTDDSALSTPLPAGEAAFFDPFHPQVVEPDSGKPKTVTTKSNNEWLLAAMETCGVVPGEQNDGTPLSSGTPDASVSLEECNVNITTIDSNVPVVTVQQKKDGAASGNKPTFFFENSSEDEKLDTEKAKESSNYFVNGKNKKGGQSSVSDTMGSNKEGPAIQTGKGDINFSVLQNDKNSDNSLAVTDYMVIPSGNYSNNLNNAVKGLKSSTALVVPEMPRNLSLFNLDIKDKGDYIFQAANQISLGQQCEANGNYHMAFNYFRTGVGILLTGVQLDENAARREVVRKKTAKYLVKAEKLHKKYIDGQGENSLNTDRWDPGKISPTQIIDPEAACLQGSLSELVNYKVIGVIDKVMLVLDNITESCYVMKVLQKSSMPNSNKKRNIVPINCPFMVNLHRFYETESAIILVLQHSPGGSLWNYISNYLHNNSPQNDIGDIIQDKHESDLRYTGRRNPDLTDCTVNSNPDNCDKNQHKINPAVDKLNSLLNTQNHISISSKISSDNDNMKIMISDDQNKVSYNSNAVCSDTGRVKLWNAENTSDNVLKDDQVSHSRILKHKNDHTDLKLDCLSDGWGNNSKEPLIMGQTSSQFEDLLKNASEKPPIEVFSVDSFDSTSGSRFESVTSDHAEHITAIQEVSETNSPLRSPVRISGKDNIKEDVFDLGNTHISNDGVSADEFGAGEKYCVQNTNLGSDTEKMLHDINMELEESDKAFNDLMGTDNLNSCVKENLTDNSHRLFTQSTPKSNGGDDFVRSLESQEENNIYDYKRSPSQSSSNSSVKSGFIIKDLPDVEHVKKDDVFSIEDHVSESDSRAVKNVVFKQPSQERSLETDNKPRNRTMSGLSTVFGDLNSASDEKHTSVKLPESCIRQWAAEIILAIEHLHRIGIVCVDLNPCNLLLGERGHVMLTYFSQWCSVDCDFTQKAVEQFSTAPEVLSFGEHNNACDWWSLGALLFELFNGKKLVTYYPSGVTSHTQLEMPSDMSSEAQDLLKQLLKCSPEERLGSSGGGVDDIKSHPFFQGVDWHALLSKHYNLTLDTGQ